MMVPNDIRQLVGQHVVLNKPSSDFAVGRSPNFFFPIEQEIVFDKVQLVDLFEFTWHVHRDQSPAKVMDQTRGELLTHEANAIEIVEIGRD